MKHLFICFFILCATISSAQMKKYIRKASRAIEKSNFEGAREYFLKAYNLDKNNYKPNEGLGVVLAEFMGKYEEAIPYLETAYNKSSKDTSIDVVYALAKSYHHMGEYDKALKLYNKLDGTVALEDDDKLYQLEIKKRKEDCLYGLQNQNNPLSKDYYILNAGPNINTSMSEYVPVVTVKNDLIFTSRRKDSPKEKINKLDGKYYESMYISKIENGKPQSARRYTVPDLYLKSKFRKHHESIISMSPDGKTLFVFRDAKIYEINIDSVTKTEPTKLAKTINFDYYQSHAYLSVDRKTLLFTSEADNSIGGIDIYKSTKGSNGEWTKPENLGKNINTEYDEDSPYLSEDGNTLYFASKGHPGFGSYDIYKSTLVNGEWTTPENLGLPINSPAHDIFMIHTMGAESGYFSSSRKGGMGDMDIYKIRYLKNFNRECINKTNPLLTISTKITDEAAGLVAFEASIPSNLTPIEFDWNLNNNKLTVDSTKFTSSITKEIDNVITLKVISYCDTCFEPLVLCNSAKVSIGKKDVIVSTEDDLVKNPYDPNLNYTYLSKSKTTGLGFDLMPVHFNLNKSNLRDDAHTILNKDAEILMQHQELSILIYGFADSRGAEKYNEHLSKQRAQHVKQYLVSKGVSNKQIKMVISKGEQFLKNNCSNDVKCEDHEHEQNRRVEFMLIEKEGK